MLPPESQRQRQPTEVSKAPNKHMSSNPFIEPSTGDLRWYAVQTSPRHEKVVAETLKHKGYEQLLPLYKTRRQWADRIKELELPLFPGYVFCRFNRKILVPILNSPGVRDIVRIGRELAPLDDDEISSLRIAVSSGLTCMPWQQLEPGERVRIGFGALAGATGTVVQVKNGIRVVLSVSLLNRSVAVEVDIDALAPVEVPRADMAPRAVSL